LSNLLRETIAADRFPLSPRVRRWRAILDKLEPPAPRAARLGHKDGGALLLKVYVHSTDKAAREAADRISGLFSKL
jgi:hypothetical protein